MSDFFITLVSNSSMKLFPGNKTSSFTVLLPEKITLRGSWSVAVAEIHYNYNFFNVSDGNNKVKLIKKYMNDQNTNAISKNAVEEITIEKGYYMSVTDIIDVINKRLKSYMIKEGPLFSFDHITNRILVHRENLQQNIGSLFLEGRLSMQLGFIPERDVLLFKTSPHVGNTRFGIPDQMLIYTDIIEPTFIGHEKAYVIKIVNTEPKHYTFGDACYKEYTHMHYMNVQKRELESISVDIRDHTGNFIPFQHGVLMIKLHFKKHDV